MIRERAEARLSGKPIPPLPDASRVSNERLAAIVAEAGKKPPAEIHPYLKGLTYDERAAWRKWTNDPGEIPVPQSVRDLRFLVIGRADYDSEGQPDDKNAGHLETGFVFNAANLKSYADSIAADPAKHSRTLINLSPTFFAQGLEVSARVFPLPEKKAKDKTEDVGEDDSTVAQGYIQETPWTPPFPSQMFRSVIEALGKRESAEAVIVVACVAPNLTLRDSGMFWWIEKGKAKPADSTYPTLKEVIDAISDNPPDPDFEIQIAILTKADAEKIKEFDSQNTSEDPFSRH
jgi:hypothetical protein